MSLGNPMNNSQKNWRKPYLLIQVAWEGWGRKSTSRLRSNYCNPFSVELIRVNYDVRAAADGLEGMEHLKLCQCFFAGYLETYSGRQDPRNDMGKKCV